ncbi:MAG: ATP-binding protein [Planctomycetota bacterium]
MTDAASTAAQAEHAAEHAVELRLLSHPTYLAGARELVSGISRRLGFDDKGSGKIALAVDEALANIINHGYQRAPDRPIWIKLWSEAGPGLAGVRIVVEDEAPHVDVAKICGRDLEDVKPGGLGVHIIKEVMDSAEYSTRDPVGMRLTMVKHLNDTHAPCPDGPAPMDTPANG